MASRPLIIVESPAKAKTLGRFLGAGYRVEASFGHIRKKWTLPIGAGAEIDADAGTLRLLRPAVA